MATVKDGTITDGHHAGWATVTTRCHPTMVTMPEGAMVTLRYHPGMWPSTMVTTHRHGQPWSAATIRVSAGQRH